MLLRKALQATFSIKVLNGQLITRQRLAWLDYLSLALGYLSSNLSLTLSAVPQTILVSLASQIALMSRE